VDNTISRLRENGRIPETTPFGQPTPWRHANGSAIWLSSGSDENQILDNTFDDVAGPAVFVEGDRNLVITRSPEDEVRNLGSGNRVTARPGTHSLYNTADSEEIAVRRTLDAYFTAFKAQDTTRIRELTAPDFVLYEGGFPVERDRWTETWDPATAASPGRQAAEHRFRDMEITILGDVASLSYVLEWLEDGEVSIRGRETGLARNLDGSWRFVRFHSTWFPPIRSRGGGALDDYVGTYRAEGLDLTWDLLVVRDGERLYMVRDDGKPQLAGLVRLQLFPEADDRFYLEVTTDRVVMDRDSTRAVVGLTVHPSILWGQAFRWIRIEEASR
jgi:ketosteroid isomerase-like protein